jgi:hypothetical protein
VSESGARSAADSSALVLQVLLGLPPRLPGFMRFGLVISLPERCALPVCTTVVPPPPVAPAAAPNAEPAAEAFATGWVLCCSSAGGRCCVGGSVCGDAPSAGQRIGNPRIIDTIKACRHN